MGGGIPSWGCVGWPCRGGGTGLSPPWSSCWWPRPALGQRLAPGLPGGLPMLMSPGGLVAPAGARGDTTGDTTGTPSSPAGPAMPRSFLVKKKPPSTRGPNYGRLHARGEAAPGTPGTPDPNWCLGGGEFLGLRGVGPSPSSHPTCMGVPVLILGAGGGYRVPRCPRGCADFWYAQPQMCWGGGGGCGIPIPFLFLFFGGGRTISAQFCSAQGWARGWGDNN